MRKDPSTGSVPHRKPRDEPPVKRGAQRRGSNCWIRGRVGVALRRGAERQQAAWRAAKRPEGRISAAGRRNWMAEAAARRARGDAPGDEAMRTVAATAAANAKGGHIVRAEFDAKLACWAGVASGGGARRETPQCETLANRPGGQRVWERLKGLATAGARGVAKAKVEVCSAAHCAPSAAEAYGQCEGARARVHGHMRPLRYPCGLYPCAHAGS